MNIVKHSLKEEIKNQLKERDVVYSLTVRIQNELQGTECWFIFDNKARIKSNIKDFKEFCSLHHKVLISAPSYIIYKDGFGHVVRTDFIVKKYKRRAA